MQWRSLMLFLPILVLPLLLMCPSAPVDALAFEVDTDIPPYIGAKNLTLNGTYEDTYVNVTDANDADFGGGTMSNTSVYGDRVELDRQLAFDILNGGKPILTAGVGLEWDLVLFGMHVVRVNSTYYLYYSGGISWNRADIGLATSKDGVNWTKFPGNPVLDSNRYAGDPDRSYVSPVVHHDGTGFHMYYSRWDGASLEIHYATSADGENWTRYARNPVVDNVADPNAWNWDVWACSLLADGSTYRMYYYGHGTGHRYQLALATSNDLVNWTDHPGNPLRTSNTSTWEGDYTTYGTAEANGSSYRLWSSSADDTTGPWSVGWLSSFDGAGFTDSGLAVLAPEAGTIYARGVADPVVIDVGGHYVMFGRCFNASGVVSYGAFNVTYKGLDGRYTSRVHDASGEVRVLAMNWRTNATLGGNASLSFRWANRTNAWSSWYALGNGPKPLNVTARYFQYVADLKAPRDWMRPSLEMFHYRYVAPVDSIYAIVNYSWAEIPFADGLWEGTVDLDDGDYDIDLWAEDTVGNSRWFRYPVLVDWTGPWGRIWLCNGTSTTNSRYIQYNFFAMDKSPVVEYRVSPMPDVGGGIWMPFAKTGVYVHPGGEAMVTLYVEFKNAADHVSRVYNDSVAFDISPPNATFAINGGAVWTNSTRLHLDLDWQDVSGVVVMKVGTMPDVATVGKEVTPERDIELEVGPGEGERRVYVWLKDRGNMSTLVSDTILVDTVLPNASLFIDAEAMYCSSTSVVLDMTGSDANPLVAMFRNGGDPWPTDWSAFDPPMAVPWLLSEGGDGPRSVVLRVRDPAGNTVESTDAIILDSTPPEASLVIADGIEQTTGSLVTCSVSYSDALSGVHLMRVGNSADLSDIMWQPLTTSLDWVLSPGDGLKTVHLEVTDWAGNVAAVWDTIALDTTPPEGTMTLDAGADFSGSATVIVSLDVEDAVSGLDSMRVSEVLSFGDAPDWQPFNDLFEWTFTGGDGERSLYIRVRDRAGNFATVTDSIVVDTTGPDGSVTLDAGAQYTSRRTVTVEVEASDDTSGIASMLVSEDGSFAGAEPRPLAGAFNWTFGGPEGMRTLHVRLLDGAGNAVEVRDDIAMDLTAPGGAVTVDDGATYTARVDVDLSVDVTDGLSGVRSMVVSNEPHESRPTMWGPFAASVPWTLPSGDGERTVHLAVRDNAGNVAWFNASIVLDTTPPVLVHGHDDRLSTSEGYIRLTVTLSDALDPAPSAEYRVDDGDWLPFSPGSFRVEVPEGRSSLDLRATDAAGNSRTDRFVVTYEPPVEGTSVGLLFLLVVVLGAVGGAGYYLWRRRGP
jgi:hypothetical protein